LSPGNPRSPCGPSSPGCPLYVVFSGVGSKGGGSINIPGGPGSPRIPSSPGIPETKITDYLRGSY